MHWEQYWTSPGGNTPQGTNYTATCLPSRKLYKLDEPDTQDTAGEARMNSSVMYSYGPPPMTERSWEGVRQAIIYSWLLLKVYVGFCWHNDRDSQSSCQLLILIGPAQPTKSFCFIELLLRTLNSELNCELNSTPNTDSTSDFALNYLLASVHCLYKLGAGSWQFLVTPMNNDMQIAWTTDIPYIFLKKFQMALLTGTKNEFRTPAVFCPDNNH